jgi:hypothetical protein
MNITQITHFTEITEITYEKKFNSRELSKPWPKSAAAGLPTRSKTLRAFRGSLAFHRSVVVAAPSRSTSNHANMLK